MAFSDIPFGRRARRWTVTITGLVTAAAAAGAAAAAAAQQQQQQNWW